MTESRPIVFTVTEESGGGVVTRMQKWISILISLGESVRVIAVRDHSCVFTPRIKRGSFGAVDVETVSLDSLDKADCSTERLASHPTLSNARAIVSSKYIDAGLLAEKLKGRGWTGCYIEVVPSDDEVTLKSIERNLQAADVIAAVSRKLVTDLGNRYANASKSVLFTPGGVLVNDINGEERDWRDLPLRVCFLGRFDPVQKRIFDLPRIAAHVAKAGTKCAWAIAGGDLDELRAQFAACGLANSVCFPGRIPHDEVTRFLRTQHVFVLPSAFEGLANVLCEAAEAGCVPISTRVSGADDVIDDQISGFIVEIGDVEGIARRIVHLDQDRARLARMSAKIREKAVRDLSTARFANELLEGIRHWELRAQDRLPNGTGKHRIVDRRLLESPWVPNIVTRTVRRSWRWWRGRPKDAAPVTRK